ncbi:hypothetical protein K0B96_05400 [Horticoccus luteus]|uniref:Uncharacterized protein n=1 Tax=Horticoccus luteus TaxID=2862869 RepID=A0A8F9TVU2_9BACT|nr:hypothetical protein [Horticoccus luteus]QYM80056.1 hypothetical protein K0B96_05400 [Horticoccus luteus]
MNPLFSTATHAAAESPADLPPWVIAIGAVLVAIVGVWLLAKVLKWVFYFVLAAAVLAGAAGVIWLVLR